MKSPPGPPPTMSTSVELSMSGCIINGLSRQPAVTFFPRTRSRDPERQQDQFQIEPEARAPQIHPIEPELAGPRDVARRVDLRQPGEPRPHAMTRGVAGNPIELHRLAIAAHV